MRVILWRAGWGVGLAYLGGVAGLNGSHTASEGALSVRRTLAVVLAIPQARGQACTGRASGASSGRLDAAESDVARGIPGPVWLAGGRAVAVAVGGRAQV